MEKSEMEGHRERIRQRYIEGGINGLLEYEVLELLLSYIIPRKDCKKNAKELLEKFGSVRKILDADYDELINSDGLGERSVVFFKFVKDLHILYLKQQLSENGNINGTTDLIKYLRASLAGLKMEVFDIIFLDTQNKFITSERLFEGTIDKSHIYMRDIVARVIKNSAKSVIFCHNHPSGVLTPSRQDINITIKAKEFLKEIDVNLLDHIIVSSEGYYSFLENNLI